MRLLVLLLCLPSFVIAQRPKSPKTYASTITAADLKKHLYIVAGPEMEGRETAVEGERRAAAYIIGHFKKFGLTPETMVTTYSLSHYTKTHCSKRTSK